MSRIERLRSGFEERLRSGLERDSGRALKRDSDRALVRDSGRALERDLGRGGRLRSGQDHRSYGASTMLLRGMGESLEGLEAL